MATSSRFNRPYGPSAQGQAPWERLQSQPFGSDSLANRAATPSGRGYYDPERILERVARGRPGTSMQQAQAAMTLEGFKELEGLLGREGQTPMQQPPMTPPLPDQAPAAGGAMNRFQRNRKEANSFQNTLGPVPTNAQLGGMNTRRPGIAGYLDIMQDTWNDPAKFKFLGT